MPEAHFQTLMHLIFHLGRLVFFFYITTFRTDSGPINSYNHHHPIIVLDLQVATPVENCDMRLSLIVLSTMHIVDYIEEQH